MLDLQADLTSPGALSAALAACDPIDAVVHLAAISFVGHADDTAFYAVNTVGTSNLLTALAQLPEGQKPGTVLVASSANVYGNCDTSPISEVQPPAPVNHYAASKLAMEYIAKSYSDRLPIIVARPFNYTGTGQASSFIIPKLIDHFARKESIIELGNIHVEREFNDVRMVCESYLRLLEHGKTGETYNICSGEPHSLQSVIRRLTLLTGHSIDVKVNPKFVRNNEVFRLSGNPSKLTACIGSLPTFPLDETLSEMLSRHTPA